MQRHPLGRTGLTVPALTLGTMTWGRRNTAAEAFQQMDRAMAVGCDCFDAAEMYPIPTRAESVGRTEEIIGEWFRKTGRRNEVTLATKITGSKAEVRGGAGINVEEIPKAIEASLTRLGTDRIDLYQLHWPERGHYHFRRQWSYDPSTQDSAESLQWMADVMGALGRAIDRGQIRAVGLSNDTAWGVMRMLRLAEETGLPRVASLQNEYSLLYRMHDTDMAEISHHEGVGLLAYSPLAAGILSGKYSGGAVPEPSRGAEIKGIGGRLTPRAWAAADAYGELAREHGLDPVQMALAFCLTRPFMTSAIIGATAMDQLERALGAATVTLSEEVLAGIDRIHRAMPQPY